MHTRRHKHADTHTHKHTRTSTHADTRRHTHNHARTRTHMQTHADTRRHTQTHNMSVCVRVLRRRPKKCWSEQGAAHWLIVPPFVQMQSAARRNPGHGGGVWEAASLSHSESELRRKLLVHATKFWKRTTNAEVAAQAAAVARAEGGFDFYGDSVGGKPGARLSRRGRSRSPTRPGLHGEPGSPTMGGPPATPKPWMALHAAVPTAADPPTPPTPPTPPGSALDPATVGALPRACPAWCVCVCGLQAKRPRCYLRFRSFFFVCVVPVCVGNLWAWWVG
jgi:hypothetical protein